MKNKFNLLKITILGLIIGVILVNGLLPPVLAITPREAENNAIVPGATNKESNSQPSGSTVTQRQAENNATTPGGATNKESNSQPSGSTTTQRQAENNNTAPNTLRNAKKGKKCGDVKTSIIQCSEGEENQIIYLLKRAIYILYGVIGVLAVVMIIVAGVIYTAAGDSDEKVRTAKTMIKNTVIGIILFMFMTIILEFLIPGGVFR